VRSGCRGLSESGLHVRVTRDIRTSGSRLKRWISYIYVASVKDTLSTRFADMLVVFSEHPNWCYSERDRRSATVPFPARNVPIVSVDAAVIVLFPLLSVSSGLHVRVTRDIRTPVVVLPLVIRLLYMFVFVASVKDTLDPFADMLKLVVFRIHTRISVRSERDRRCSDRSVPGAQCTDCQRGRRSSIVLFPLFRVSRRSVRWNSPVC
jgi:hypothetical protein